MTKQEQSIIQMSQEVKKLRHELLGRQFESTSGKVKNIHQPRQLRKQIARLLTKIHQMSYHHD